MLEFGRKPEENDSLDQDQVLPLWQADWLFLTSDKRLAKCLELGGMAAKRFRLVQGLDAAEWMAAASAA